jgi:protein tyrosine/serine phosphatase
MKILILILGLGVSGYAWATDAIPNFEKVNDSVYRGGRPTAAGMDQLAALGIKTDIDLQGGDVDSSDSATNAFMKWWEPGDRPENIAQEKSWALSRQIGFVSEPLRSISEVTAAEDVEIDQILTMMNDKALQPVFVHCEHGNDRTGMIIALYQVKFENKNPEDAHCEWMAHGHSGAGAYFTGDLDKYFCKKTSSNCQLDCP